MKESDIAFDLTGDGAMPTKVTNKKTEPVKAAPVKKGRNPTADTRRALAELESGKLTRYVDEDDMFKKLGIKIGKTKP